MNAWLRKSAALVVAVAGLVFLWRGLAIMAAGVAVLVVVAFWFDRWRRWRAIRRFRAEWGALGRDVLLVYSNSPNWQTHAEQSWLPRWGDRAVVLNWSDRRLWPRHSPAVQLFRVCSGDREFNPLGIVVPPAGRKVHIVRFWQAFRDHKHGKLETLSRAEAELDRHLSGASAPDKPTQPTSV